MYVEYIPIEACFQISSIPDLVYMIWYLFSISVELGSSFYRFLQISLVLQPSPKSNIRGMFGHMYDPMYGCSRMLQYHLLFYFSSFFNSQGATLQISRSQPSWLLVITISIFLDGMYRNVTPTTRVSSQDPGEACRPGVAQGLCSLKIPIRLFFLIQFLVRSGPTLSHWQK